MENKEKDASSSGDDNYKYKHIITWGICLLFAVFILLPGLFILLGSAFPDYISSDGALQQLSENVNSLVGFFGLIVGAYSIYYAIASNNLLDKQRLQQANFLKDIDRKVDNINSGLMRLQSDNEKLFDRIEKFDSEKRNTKKSKLNTMEPVTKKDESV